MCVNLRIAERGSLVLQIVHFSFSMPAAHAQPRCRRVPKSWSANGYVYNSWEECFNAGYNDWMRILVCTVDHAMICHMGVSFPTIHHNEIRDITTLLLTEVYNNVVTKPPLQPLGGESMTARSAITDDEARVDIPCKRILECVTRCIFRCKGFLPKRILQPFKREYGQRMGKEATTFYKCLADMIAQKRQHPYPAVTGWL